MEEQQQQHEQQQQQQQEEQVQQQEEEQVQQQEDTMEDQHQNENQQQEHEVQQATETQKQREETQEQQQQQQQSQQELTKLRAIENKAKQVQDKLTARLPHQRSQLIARVCGSIWLNRVRLTAATSNNTPQQQDAQSQYEQITKKMRMELGAFDYHVKEQGELLTRYLCELDNILSFGNAEVKDARKALVVYIQGLLTTADALRVKSAKLKEFGEKLLATLPKPATEDKVVSESDDTEQDVTDEQKSAPTKTGEENEESNDVEMKPLFAEEEEDEDEEESNDGNDNDNGKEGEEDEEDMDEDAPSEDEVDAEPQNEAPTKTQTQPHPFLNHIAQQQRQQQRQPAVDTRSLPLWRPYYQLQKRRDGLYLVANLHDVDQQSLRVQWNAHTGVLRVMGHKLPTQKDLVVSRFSGVPTFGRFEIVERLPANAFNMDHATQQLSEDGTLEIRMPYRAIRQHPHFFGPWSVFDAPKSITW